MKPKRVILCPNPYRDSELKVCRQSRDMLESLGMQASVCLPFQREGYGEELGLPMVMERKHSDTPMCANVDMYSGLVYAMLGIPEEVFTPLFASARIAGWCANRMEEVITCHRIMRPAYRAVTIKGHYVPIEERTAKLVSPEA